jgi:hypothetical protein
MSSATTANHLRPEFPVAVNTCLHQNVTTTLIVSNTLRWRKKGRYGDHLGLTARPVGTRTLVAIASERS